MIFSEMHLQNDWRANLSIELYVGSISIAHLHYWKLFCIAYVYSSGTTVKRLTHVRSAHDISFFSIGIYINYLMFMEPCVVI
jgi:hypothetical protein